HRGRILSLPRLVGSCQEKHSLGRQHDALAVDMESAAIADLCRRHEVPFGCVRAISDRLDTPLSPKLLTLLSGSDISAVKLTQALLKSPTLAGELWGLAKATRQAAIQLQRALGELLTLTLPWGKEL